MLIVHIPEESWHVLVLILFLLYLLSGNNSCYVDTMTQIPRPQNNKRKERKKK